MKRNESTKRRGMKGWVGGAITAAAAFVWSGCAASLTTLDTAEALKPESVSPEYTIGVNFPVSAVWELANEAYGIYEDVLEEGEDFQPTEEQVRTLMKSIMYAALYPPAVPNTIGFQVGLAPRFNVGLRYSGGFSFNTKYQLIDRPGRALAIAAEFQHQSSSANTLLDLYGSDGFEANSGMLQLIYSRNFRDIFKPYVALKGRYTRYHVSEFVDEIADLLENYTDQELNTELDGNVWAYGGALGFLIGYKYIFGAAEMTVMNLSWDTVLVGEPTHVSGIILAPAVGLKVIVPPYSDWPAWMKRKR